MALHSPVIVPAESKPYASPQWTVGLSVLAAFAAGLVTIRVAITLGLGAGGMGAPNVGDAVFLLALAAAQTTLGLLFRRDAERFIRERLVGTWHGRAALGVAALTPTLAIALGDCALSALFYKIAQS